MQQDFQANSLWIDCLFSIYRLQTSEKGLWRFADLRPKELLGPCSITEWFGLDGSLKITSSNPPAMALTFFTNQAAQSPIQHERLSQRTTLRSQNQKMLIAVVEKRKRGHQQCCFRGREAQRNLRCCFFVLLGLEYGLPRFLVLFSCQI